MWLKLPRCKSCCLPQGGGCNSYNLLFPPSLSSSLPPPFSSFSSLLLFLSSYSPARLSSSGRELWIFRRSSCKCFTMSGDWWWCAPNFFHQERSLFFKLSPRKVWFGQFHLRFCKDSLSPMWLMIDRVLSFYTALPLAVWPNVSLWPSEYVHVHHGEGHNVALMNQYNLKTFRIDLVVVEIIQHTWLEVAIRQYLIFSTCNAFAAWPTCPLWETMISFQGSLPK